MTTPQTPPADAVARLTKLADDYASRGDFATEDDIRTLLAAYADAARDRERVERFVVEALNDEACAELLRMLVSAARNSGALPTALAYWPPFERLTGAARTGEAR